MHPRPSDSIKEYLKQSKRIEEQEQEWTGRNGPTDSKSELKPGDLLNMVKQESNSKNDPNKPQSRLEKLMSGGKKKYDGIDKNVSMFGEDKSIGSMATGVSKGKSSNKTGTGPSWLRNSQPQNKSGRQPNQTNKGKSKGKTPISSKVVNESPNKNKQTSPSKRPHGGQTDSKKQLIPDSQLDQSIKDQIAKRYSMLQSTYGDNRKGGKPLIQKKGRNGNEPVNRSPSETNQIQPPTFGSGSME